MLYFYTGSDSDALRKKLSSALPKGSEVVRITDAHSLPDMEAALAGAGMFGEARTIVLDHVLQNETLRETLLARLPSLRSAEEKVFLIESGLDAETRKRVEKYAEETVRADVSKVPKDNSVFALANALQAGKKKELWVAYQKELHKGSAPEAIHGLLFWAAKQSLLRSDTPRARALVAALSELPHEARRRGEELEYALERFVLS